ncbi:heme lyase CcmF/NrfE family subunit [Thalassospira alkalitolerans]|uniref:Cytochrome C biogenesis protein CycK n=1 Tax=Thalassospira alkalitolerans TaxID=1293890 RepID=A0A1Y2L9V3_9PROT|nr:cytochrome c-type biogenesis CcmF C-terminal domain-containing protein [Thalassospira alkalitolerans]OSQ44383.1 cytochrome C biogenesis protein CycK [Thalassospira alkalitolerans]|tara:strand:+ start:11178 stop:13223 length:2046 start_codon:yes stop_codon:yes gene_type:complete
MIAEFGHFALILILVLGCCQAVLFCPALFRAGYYVLAPVQTLATGPVTNRSDNGQDNTTHPNHLSVWPLPFAMCILAIIAETALIHSFIVSDFTLSIVANYSHSSTPMLYRIGAAFIPDSGAMLLWVTASTIATLLFAVQTTLRGITQQDRVTLGILAIITALLAAATLIDADPFLRSVMAPLDGRGLDPQLQDVPGILRGPVLYAGLAGLSVIFAATLAALPGANLDRSWSELLRPWALASWTLLGAAIAINAYRAYTEQAWGNWWYWDTSENALLLPWLLSTAFLHCRAVMEKTETLKPWAALLALSAFGAGWFGTFLVRSDLLGPLPTALLSTGDSVALLVGFCILFAGAYFMYWRCAGGMVDTKDFSLISRESGMFISSVMLSVTAATVLIGTIYPLILRWFDGDIITVGPPFFVQALIPIGVPMLFLMGFAPTLRWRNDEAWLIGRRMKLAALLSLIVVLFVWMRFIDASPVPLLGIGLAAWVFTAALGDLWERLWRQPDHGEGKYRNFQLLGPRYLSMTFAHIGIAILIAGGSASAIWEQQVVLSARTGQSIQIGPYNLQYEGVALLPGENFATRKATFIVYRNALPVTELFPEVRYYPIRGIETKEADIWHGRDGDLHVSIGERAEDGGRVVTVRFLPMMPWVWGGMLLMLIGGVISIGTRVILRYKKNGVPAS